MTPSDSKGYPDQKSEQLCNELITNIASLKGFTFQIPLDPAQEGWNAYTNKKKTSHRCDLSIYMVFTKEEPYICLTPVLQWISGTSPIRLPLPVVCRRQRGSIQTGCLCYNAVKMRYPLHFANSNNHNDDDDHRIVGRSFAG